ncbi:helix-turn-helix domain-containing protein [Paenisporosarcina antarctica]|uniref:Helix-turn-helix domain-containing protein n=1 Tax=Paenisporosarcina antarctica TaxID=417367 RepID=A0A4P6ZUT1_9BACL|nr:hypothetical protein [Paenisporosarcina antarctica]QBP39719.1 hypothetical protein E2636_00440 [Paenisporosarcina antarctica]
MYYLSEYQTFTSVKEMDKHVQQHTNAHYHELIQTDRDVLSLLSRYSCKFPGAAHLKVETIMKALSKSDVTIRRAIRKLAKLHIIEKISFIRRVSKGYGANILRILPFEDKSTMITRSSTESVTPVSVQSPEIEKQTSLSNNLIQDTYDTEDAIKEGLITKLPERIGRILGAFFDMNTVYKVYGIMLRAKAKIDRTMMFEEYEEDYISAILSVVNAYKRGRVKNIFGVLYAAILSATKRLYVTALFNDAMDR